MSDWYFDLKHNWRDPTKRRAIFNQAPMNLFVNKNHWEKDNEMITDTTNLLVTPQCVRFGRL